MKTLILLAVFGRFLNGTDYNCWGLNESEVKHLGQCLSCGIRIGKIAFIVYYNCHIGQCLFLFHLCLLRTDAQ